MRRAMMRESVERIPTMPQICHDTAVRVFQREDGIDWIEATRRCLEEPRLVHDYVIRLVRRVGADGLRLFLPGLPRKAVRREDELVCVDPDTGDRTGRVDLHGGGAFLPDKPEPPVETLDDVKARLAGMEAGYTDQRIAVLAAARARVPDLFVASSPVALTMNTYVALRGRAQAMMDFFDRPAFVESAMALQAEAGIRTGERLLTAGIDAFYIGDPSASASLISPAQFERFCLPAYRTFCSHFRSLRPELCIYLHICGNSKPILEMMADSGAHAVEPLDPLGGVSVADAKRRIGSRVCLMGGVNTLTLARETPDMVRAESIRACREGGPLGYVLAAGDMVPPATPLANIQALVDTAVKSLWRA